MAYLCVLSADPPLPAEVAGARAASASAPAALVLLPAGAEAAAACACAACRGAGACGVAEPNLRGLLCRLALAPAPGAAAVAAVLAAARADGAGGAPRVAEFAHDGETTAAALRRSAPARVLLSSTLRAYACRRGGGAHAGSLFDLLRAAASAAGADVAELAPAAGDGDNVPWVVHACCDAGAAACGDDCTFGLACEAAGGGTFAAALLRARAALVAADDSAMAAAPLLRSAAARYALYAPAGAAGLRALAGWHGREAVAALWRDAARRGAAADDDGGNAAAAAAATYHVAVFGGAFSPVTVGHLAVACEVLRLAGRGAPAASVSAASLAVDELWLCPSGARPDKPSLRVAAWPRFAMAVLALECAAAPARVRVAALELWRGAAAPSRALLAALAAAHPRVRFSLVIGADLLPALPTWVDAPALLREVAFIIVSRAGYGGGGGSGDACAPGGAGWPRRATALPLPAAPAASSSEARALLARAYAAARGGGAAAAAADDAWRAALRLLPPAALAYALEHRLYDD
jgi:nicotinic acid mononucleotide adenylyltransferase